MRNIKTDQLFADAEKLLRDLGKTQPDWFDALTIKELRDLTDALARLSEASFRMATRLEVHAQPRRSKPVSKPNGPARPNPFLMGMKAK